MEIVAVGPELAHRAEHGDAPPGDLLLAEHLQGRRHRGRIGVVAFVDQQGGAAFDRDQMALAPALQPAQLGEREPGRGEIAADRLDRGQHRQRIGHPMLAGLAQREAQLRRRAGCAVTSEPPRGPRMT